MIRVPLDHYLIEGYYSTLLLTELTLLVMLADMRGICAHVARRVSDHDHDELGLLL
jgi:hypothetical protein